MARLVVPALRALEIVAVGSGSDLAATGATEIFYALQPVPRHGVCEKRTQVVRSRFKSVRHPRRRQPDVGVVSVRLI
jgi:hypothetical protein